jgi:hypothetical protein
MSLAERRLRIGILAIAAILAVYVLLVMRDWRTTLEHDYAARTEHLYKMKALAGQPQWLARAQSAAKVRAALEAQIPAAATTGLAQASVQGWVRELTNAMGEDLRIQAGQAEAVEGRPGLWRVPVTLSGSLDNDRYLGLLGRIESRPTLSVVEEATVNNRKTQAFSLTIVSYFRVAEAADAGA